MLVIDPGRLLDHRAQTFHTQPGLTLLNAQDAIRFVNERGFVFFWPIQAALLPSLWVAAAGDRPVPDDHDDPGHITWDWKDDQLDKRQWYYAKILRRKSTIISLEALPFFYALSPNYGEAYEDMLDQYHQGLVSLEEKQIFEALLREGPLDSLSLKRSAHLSSVQSEGRFNRAMDLLQTRFRVLPVGISRSGGWKYSFIWDLTDRYWPDLLEQARPISESQARVHLIERYLNSVGAASTREIRFLFGWTLSNTTRAIEKIVAAGALVRASLGKEKEPAVALPALVVDSK